MKAALWLLHGNGHLSQVSGMMVSVPTSVRCTVLGEELRAWLAAMSAVSAHQERSVSWSMDCVADVKRACVPLPRESHAAY